jgi:hypothetical protein
MTDSGWQYPGGDPPGPYGGGAPPPSPPTPPPAPGQPGQPGQHGQPPPAWNGVPGSAHDPAAVPWQQPQYGAPQGPPPNKRWPMIALFGAVVLLVVAIIGVAVTSGDGDDDTVTGTDDIDEPSDSTEPDGPDETEPEEPDDPEGPSDPDAFVDDEGGFAITMADGWAYTALHGDLEAAGAQMFPDDPAKAQLVQQAVGTLPNAIIFYGVRGDEVGTNPFVTNVNINSTSTPGAGELSYEEFATEVRNGIDLIGATVTGDEPFTLAGTEGIRVEFDYDPSLNASGVQYSAVIDDQLWVVNFASADVAAHEADFDAIASSFELVG